MPVSLPGKRISTNILTNTTTEPTHKI